MSNPLEYEKFLTGTKDDVTIAKTKIRDLLARCRSDAKRLQGCVLVLRSISTAVETPAGIYHAEYCDILEDLSDSLKPESNIPMWERYLEFLRYFHNILLQKRLYVEASRVFHHLSKQSDQMLQHENNYAYVLSTYGNHLVAQCAYLQIDEAKAKADITDLLHALIKLYDKMLECNEKLDFFYPNLVLHFKQSFLQRPTPKLLNYLATLPKVVNMFNAFFKLLANLKATKPLDANGSAKHCQHVLDLLLRFMKIDEGCNLEHSLAVQYLIASDSSALFMEPTARYPFSLLRMLMHFIYSPYKVGNFSHTFPKFCVKFVSLFTSNDTKLMEQPWFADMIVALSMIMSSMQDNAKTLYQAFWKQMETVQCYLAYSQLIMNCLKMCTNISTTNLLSHQCCTSVRKHIVLRYAQQMLAAYVTFPLNVKELQESDQPAFNELNTNIQVIMRHACQVLKTMSCVTTWEANDLKILVVYYYKLKSKFLSPAHAAVCVSIGELFQFVSDKLGTKLYFIVHIMYKMALETQNPKLIAEMHCIFIAHQLVKEDEDPNKVRNYVMDFYANSPSGKKHTTTIIDIYNQSQQPLKPKLELQHKRQLFYLETQAIQRFQNDNAHLQLIVVHQHSCLYDLAYAVKCFHSVRKTPLEEEILNMLRNARARLTDKSKLGEIPPLEQLALGIICSILLKSQLKELKKQVNALNIEIKCIDKLENVIQNACFKDLNINNELKTIECAVQAVKAFEEFHYKADSSLTSTTDVCIEWDTILSDLAYIAYYLQFTCYIEHATRAWLLHYRMSQKIQNHYNSMCSFSFFCENVAYFALDSSPLDLAKEVQQNESLLMEILPNLSTQLKRNQKFTLICIAQLAYYYAYVKSFRKAALYLEFVYVKHKELAGDDDGYDIVLATLDFVKFRISCRQFDEGMLKSNLLHELSQVLEKFIGFKYYSSVDPLIYINLLANIVEEFTVCSANRLYDSNIRSYYGSLFKIALTMGATMRLIHVLAAGVWMNLQQEAIEKAQFKLTLIQYLLGVESFNELENVLKSKIAEKKDVYTQETESAGYHNEMEIVRKTAVYSAFAPLQGPVYADQRDISRFLDHIQDWEKHTEQEENITLTWTNITIAVLYARLSFLRNDGIKLNELYSKLIDVQGRKQNGEMLVLHSSNIHLLCMQHYAHYLCSQKNDMAAITFIENALRCSKARHKNADFVYQVNLQLQLQALQLPIKEEKQKSEEEQIKELIPRLNDCQIIDFDSSSDSNDAIFKESTNNIERKESNAIEEEENEIQETPRRSRTRLFMSCIAKDSGRQKKEQCKESSPHLNKAQIIDLDSSSDSNEEICKESTNNIEPKESNLKDMGKTDIIDLDSTKDCSEGIDKKKIEPKESNTKELGKTCVIKSSTAATNARQLRERRGREQRVDTLTVELSKLVVNSGNQKQNKKTVQRNEASDTSSSTKETALQANNSKKKLQLNGAANSSTELEVSTSRKCATSTRAAKSRNVKNNKSKPN